MSEQRLELARYAIENAKTHLEAAEMPEAVDLLDQIERMIENKLIQLAPPPEPGLIQGPD